MFISPQTIYLSKRLDTVMKNNESIQVMKGIEYVSIKETVQILLENEKIKHAIDQSSTVIDKFDKQYYTEHELFKNKKNLKILLYYDGLQTTNALGDTNGVYKCAMFYFAIENLTRKHNSCLKNIFLIAIMFDQDIKLYCFEKSLLLIMTDICFLQIHGIQIKSEMLFASQSQFQSSLKINVLNLKKTQKVI
jgi:regulator of replication initiation timing